jgi:hypothetical protein
VEEPIDLPDRDIELKAEADAGQTEDFAKVLAELRQRL